jgi:hypothetical protein
VSARLQLASPHLRVGSEKRRAVALVLTNTLSDYAAVKRGKPYSPSLKWQTQLNLVFAIAAMRSHLIAAEWRRDEHDHLIYHSRALALSEMDPWWFSRQDLPQMQITGMDPPPPRVPQMETNSSQGSYPSTV